MAGNMKMDFGALEDSAKKYGTGADDIDQVLQNLTSEQQVILGIWEGEAARQFDAQFQELSPKVQQFAELLRDINSQLNESARIMRETDEQLSKVYGLQ
ncbi:WXG100 family type VII secretion target [Enterococcus sp. LJL51]|uniref:WXG100 family type VII secretion target n=1 Tax=Enterococcus sp. LJL51 TaxID=3416656 RepID=UPI003CE75E32